MTTDMMNALAARVKAKREAAGLGLNVRYVGLDGRKEEFSFATPDRANAFRAKIASMGCELLK